jgi:hypothetical protein
LVTYPANPAQYAQDIGNPKSEVRNPKQVGNSNAEISKRSEGQFSFPADLIFLDCFGLSDVGLRPRYGFRDSSFPAVCSVPAPAG